MALADHRLQSIEAIYIKDRYSLFVGVNAQGRRPQCKATAVVSQPSEAR